MATGLAFIISFTLDWLHGRNSGFDDDIPNTEVGTARRAVCGRLGEATLPKADLLPGCAASQIRS